MLKIVKLKKFDRFSNKVKPMELKKYIYIQGNYAIELFEDEKIIRLNIPHGDMYAECSKKEWDEIIDYLKTLGLKID